jgi:hypothetical protein
MLVHGYTAKGDIAATIDGVRVSVPDDPANRDRRRIAEWETAGNTVPAFEPPPTPPAENGRALLIRQRKAAKEDAHRLMSQGKTVEAFTKLLELIPDDPSAL